MKRQIGSKIKAEQFNKIIHLVRKYFFNYTVKRYTQYSYCLQINHYDILFSVDCNSYSYSLVIQRIFSWFLADKLNNNIKLNFREKKFLSKYIRSLDIDDLYNNSVILKYFPKKLGSTFFLKELRTY